MSCSLADQLHSSTVLWKKLCKKAKIQVFANNFNRLAFLKLCNRDYKIVSSIDAPSVASMPPPDWTRPKSVTLSLFFFRRTRSSFLSPPSRAAAEQRRQKSVVAQLSDHKIATKQGLGLYVASSWGRSPPNKWLKISLKLIFAYSLKINILWVFFESIFLYDLPTLGLPPSQAASRPRNLL